MCYGLDLDLADFSKKWFCDPCANESNPSLSLYRRCVLCPVEGDGSSNPLKETSGFNWAHVCCSAWVPEVLFGNAVQMKPVENIGKIPRSRWNQICSICNTNRGACVPCHYCHKHFHVGCAKKVGFLMGFDIMPVKVSRRDLCQITSLNGETGVMNAIVCCNDHDTSSITLHKINDFSNDGDEVRNYNLFSLLTNSTLDCITFILQNL